MACTREFTTALRSSTSGRGTYTIPEPPTTTNTHHRIRYAAPPVGSLRWKDAVLPSSNRTVILADTFGPACPGVLPPGAHFFPGGSEDCLFLNVWAPENAKKLPVLVWIHGGGYGYGDGTQDMTEILNDNGNSFVVVSIQYRVSHALKAIRAESY